MQHLKIKVEKTAHVFILNPNTEGVDLNVSKIRYLWFVTHGYGQLASSIIRKFEIFDTSEHFIVAPEALNRFYWDMRKGIVGASWMTKQDRLDEIEDYANYLNQIYIKFKDALPSDVRIILLGFSQGCATQLRWILRGMPHFHHLVLWGGLLPEDIDYQPLSTYFADKKIHFINGDADEFVTPERIEWHLNFAKSQGLNLNYIPFKGKHEILIDVLREFFENNIKVK